MRYILALGILAYLYGCYIAGTRSVQPTPQPPLVEPEAAALRSLEWRAPLPPQHGPERLRVTL
jgi:hypothetical protein